MKLKTKTKNNNNIKQIKKIKINNNKTLLLSNLYIK